MKVDNTVSTPQPVSQYYGYVKEEIVIVGYGETISVNSQSTPITELTERKIGSGAYKTVYKGRDGKSLKLAALQEFKFPSSQETRHELQMTNIIRNAQKQRKGSDATSRLVKILNIDSNVKGNPVIVTRLCNGNNLEDFLHTHNFENKQLLKFSIDVMLAVRALHQLGIVHRDIKLNNFLIHFKNGSIQIRLNDFGQSVKLGESNSIEKIAVYRPHAPPEYWERNGAEAMCTVASDVWQLGLVVAQIMTGIKDGNLIWRSFGKHLASKDEKARVFSLQSYLRLKKDPYYSLNLVQLGSEDLAKLLIKMMDPVTEKRPPLDTCIKRAWEIYRIEGNTCGNVNYKQIRTKRYSL